MIAKSQSGRQADRFLVLDSFRGVCACAVALAHLNANSAINYLPFFSQGHIFVDFFFVLSGFVIFQNYGRRLREGYSIPHFMWLRFWRVYPLHFVMLFVFITAALAQYYILGLGSKPMDGPDEGAYGMITNLLLIHSLGTLNSLPFNWPSWSISVEFYTYLIFAAMIVVFRRLWGVALAVLAVGSVAVLISQRDNLYAMEDYGALRCIYGFACGVVCSLVYQRVRNVHIPFATVVEGIAVAFAVAYISYWSHGAASFFAPIAFSPLVVLFALERGYVSSAFRAPWLVLIGTLSYSIYMVHIFIAGKLVLLPAVFLSTKVGIPLVSVVDGKTALGGNMLWGTAMEVGYLALVIGVSVLSYRFIEEPCRDWGRDHWPAQRRKVAEVSA